jgi:hypothetical protein
MPRYNKSQKDPKKVATKPAKKVAKKDITFLCHVPKCRSSRRPFHDFQSLTRHFKNYHDLDPKTREKYHQMCNPEYRPYKGSKISINIQINEGASQTHTESEPIDDNVEDEDMLFEGAPAYDVDVAAPTTSAPPQVCRCTFCQPKPEAPAKQPKYKSATNYTLYPKDARLVK